MRVGGKGGGGDMCMVDDADGWVTMLSSGLRTARKAHKCHECGRTIKTAELYRSESYIYEGEFQNHKTCPQCLICRQWLEKECKGWVYGGVGEDVAEHYHEADYPKAIKRDLARLVVGLRTHWKFKRMPVLPMTTFDLQARQVSP